MITSRKLSEFTCLVHGCSTKTDLTQTDAKTPGLEQQRAIFLKQISVPPEKFFWGQQVHGNRTVKLSKKSVFSHNRVPETDALITSAPGIFLGVKSADCAPLLLFDPIKNGVAAVHSGWRGTALHIVKETIHKMREAFGTHPKDLLVFIGPMIERDCYDISRATDGRKDIFEKAFPDRTTVFKKNQVPQKTSPARKKNFQKKEGVYLDLKTALLYDLENSGVLSENIEISERCTVCAPDILPSHRREGKARKITMISIIGMR